MMTDVTDNPRLRELMAEKDMTPEALCVAIDKHTNGYLRVSVDAVRTWLGGSRPRPGTQRAIAEVLDTNIAHLFPQD